MSMLLKNLARCCRVEGDGEIAIAGVSSDSRTIEEGFLFAAIPGTKADGAQFIPEALARGAVAVLIGEDVALPDIPEGVAIVRSENPSRALSLMAARFYRQQPVTIVAITGTNGKSSVAEFTRQIWTFMGFRAASMGTLGVYGPDLEGLDVGHTTPDPVHLHRVLAKMRSKAISHLAMEASSHGLAQYRLDGVRLTAGGFTSFSRDHLDYHETMDAYFEAKMRLFEELLEPPAAAVVNMDDAKGAEVARRSAERGLIVWDVGEAGGRLRLESVRAEGLGQQLEIKGMKRDYRVYLPLVGRFQVTNALVAAGLVIAAGGPEEEAVMALEHLTGARGRLDLAGRTKSGAPVYVDYAHTPDALAVALKALRPFAKGRLVVVFGAGGDRDPGKRPQMGEIARRLADVTFVTDDNPRGEEAAAIRAEILAACPGAREIADRSKAIGRAIVELGPDDILLVAGKGHETGQVVGEEVIPFSDHEEIARWLDEEMEQ